MDNYKSVVRFINSPVEFNEEVSRRWIIDTVEEVKRKVEALVYNFVPREKIVEINKRYLNHNYPTDIITFDYSEGNKIGGELFICPEVVKTNARDLSVSYDSELNRVVIHGILHLLGYNDGTKEEKATMRYKEDECLKKLVRYEDQV